jgi:acetylornithine/succinyldiaminopimelate/putrescine aminotransferase
MKQLQILHISDLHIKLKEDFDRSLVFDPFIERLKADYDSAGLRPQLPKPNIIRLVPPLIVEKKHINEMIMILTEALREVYNA